MKRIFNIMIVAVLLFNLSGCAQPRNEKVSIGVMPDVNSVPFIIAAETGVFESQGVDVEIVLFESAVERDTALQAGKIDGGVSDILAAAFAVQSEFDVKMTSVTDGDYVLLASKDSNIISIDGFKNADIGLSTNTIIEYATDSILMKNGIKEGEIKKVAIPKIPVRLEMLENGKVKGACLPQPLATLAQSKGAEVITTSTQQGLAPSVMIFSTSAIKQKREQLKKVYKAYNEVVSQINAEPVSFKEMIIEKAKFPAEIKDVLQLPQYHKAVLPEEDDVNNVLEWMKKKGLLKKEMQYEEMVEKGLF